MTFVLRRIRLFRKFFFGILQAAYGDLIDSRPSKAEVLEVV